MTWDVKVVGWDLVAPDQLLANPANYRRHPAKQREALRGSLNELGIIAPVIVNVTTGRMLDGHARNEEYLSADVEKVPVLYVEVPEEKEGLALLSLDPIAAMAEHDKEQLDALLHEAATAEPGLQAMLATLAEEAGLYLDAPEPAEDPGAQVDKAEELREKWGTERGQLWQVGKHRVMCGDSTSVDDVQTLLGGGVPVLMVTDPPYGVDYDPTWRIRAGLNAATLKRRGTVAGDDRADWTEAWALFPGDVAYVWHGGLHAAEVALSLEACDFAVRAQIIWANTHLALGRGDYHWKHEPCWYAVRQGATGHWAGDRKQTTVWEIYGGGGGDNTKQREAEAPCSSHGTQKPLECMARPIRNHEGDVYEPFLGSGTTAVAAEQLGRICYGMEIEPKYVAVTLERLAGMGLEPRLAE